MRWRRNEEINMKKKEKEVWENNESETQSLQDNRVQKRRCGNQLLTAGMKPTTFSSIFINKLYHILSFFGKHFLFFFYVLNRLFKIHQSDHAQLFAFENGIGGRELQGRKISWFGVELELGSTTVSSG